MVVSCATVRHALWVSHTERAIVSLYSITYILHLLILTARSQTTTNCSTYIYIHILLRNNIAICCLYHTCKYVDFTVTVVVLGFLHEDNIITLTLK